MGRPAARAILVSITALALWVAAAQAAIAAGTTRYVSPGGTDDATCAKSNPCLHVQHAVSIADPGDTIQIAAGTYVEQVSIGKNLRVEGAGRNASTIQAPSVMLLNGRTETYVAEINNGASVLMTNLTVAGPGAPGGGLNCAPNPLSLDKGIDVYGSGSLTLMAAAVRNVYDIPDSGCQRGDAISVGSACFTCTPDVGHAIIEKVVIDRYQKNGIAVRGASSTATIDHNTVTNIPSNVIASNGVEVLSGAFGQVSLNTISGNECDLPLFCGPDPANDQASGILFFGATAASRIDHNRLSANDVGIYTDDGVRVDHNLLTGNRYEGIFVDAGTNGGHLDHNSVNNGNYGFYVNGGSNNRYDHDSAHGNSVFDLYWNGVGAGNTFSQNSCGTASPSKTVWDC